MVKKLITVELASGLEARPAAMLVQVASQYESAIYLEAEAKRVNAKSIMGMMTLCLTAGESILVEADGKDEEAAVTEIEKYLKNQYLPVRLFGEIDNGNQAGLAWFSFLLSVFMINCYSNDTARIRRE